eukprot:g3488.t1
MSANEVQNQNSPATTAWREWLSEHAPKLFLFARNQTRTYEDAQDVLQDAIVKLVEKVKANEFVGGQEAWQPYLYTSIRRLAIDLSRKNDRRKRREDNVTADAEVDQLDAFHPWFDSMGGTEETRDQLEEALKSLPEKFSEVIVMKIWVLSAEDVGFASKLRAHEPRALSANFEAGLMEAIGDTPFHMDEKIVLFNKSNRNTGKGKGRNILRFNFAAAAAVALMGSLAALMMPKGENGAGPIAETGNEPVIEAPVTQISPAAASGFAPVGLNRNFSEARDEGVMWENNKQPHRVMRMTYLDRVTLSNDKGETIEAERNRAAQSEEAERESIPFVGLSTVPLPEMVAVHVGVEPGSGLLIRTIMPESPAANAGLSVNDIILKIGEEAVSSPEQFSALILGREIGDRLDLSLIHQGKPAKVALTLGERPAHLALNQRPEPMLEGLPQANAERLRGLIERNLREFDDSPGIAQMDETLRRMREQMNQALGNQADAESGIGPAGGFEFQQNSTVRMMDDEGSVELKSSNGSTEVTVRDKSGNITWNGPWDTEQDKAAAPDHIRPRIDRVDSGSGSGFRFHFGKAQRRPHDTIEN